MALYALKFFELLAKSISTEFPKKLFIEFTFILINEIEVLVGAVLSNTNRVELSSNANLILFEPLPENILFNFSSVVPVLVPGVVSLK